MPLLLNMNMEVIIYVAFKGVKNDTDEYITLRLEDEDDSSKLHNVIVAPHSKLRGKFDGAIFKDGTIVKVSAHAPFWVSFKVWRNKKGEIEYRITDNVSWAFDKAANAKKLYDNTFSNGNLDYSKVYHNQNLPGEKLYGWWKSAMKDLKNSLDWKQGFKLDEQNQLREKLERSL